MTGRFITFEGIDGSGKTTQIELLEKKLTIEKISYLILREPGGTKLSERIRDILLDSKNISLSSESESLLFVAARAQLMKEKIKPALQQGCFVICDRFVDSTVAYQGYGRGLNIGYLEKLNNFGTDNIYPEFTIILDIDPNKAMRRLQRTAPDRMESIGIDFFEKVQEGYYQIAKRYPDRCMIINGDQPVDIVFSLIYQSINERIIKEMACN